MIEKKQYMTMRKTIGALTILMPILSVLLGLIGYANGLNPSGWWYSISDTYWANSKIIMISFIAICSFYFCTYPGYDWRDRLVNVLSGVFLAGILIFPCSNPSYEAGSTLFCLPESLSSKFHIASALLLFIALFINVEFLFTLSNGEKTEKKKLRNIIYRICGLFIIPLALVIILLGTFNIGPKNYVWIAEAAAMIPCGVAWFVKAEALTFLNDK